jgi:hypothetical protein
MCQVNRETGATRLVRCEEIQPDTVGHGGKPTMTLREAVLSAGLFFGSEAPEVLSPGPPPPVGEHPDSDTEPESGYGYTPERLVVRWGEEGPCLYSR